MGHKNGTKIAQTFAFYHWRKEKKMHRL